MRIDPKAYRNNDYEFSIGYLRAVQAGGRLDRAVKKYLRYLRLTPHFMTVTTMNYGID